jgi:hypothetical protein
MSQKGIPHHEFKITLITTLPSLRSLREIHYHLWDNAMPEILLGIPDRSLQSNKYFLMLAKINMAGKKNPDDQSFVVTKNQICPLKSQA